MASHFPLASLDVGAASLVGAGLFAANGLSRGCRRPAVAEVPGQLAAEPVGTIMVMAFNAAQCGFHLDRVQAEVLPADKERVVRRLQEAGKRVGMVGGGADVAIESAGLTLMRHDLAGLSSARRLSRATVANIHQNLFFAFLYNALGVPLAAGVLYPWTGFLLSPMFAAAAMSLSSVSVIANALRLRGAKL